MYLNKVILTGYITETPVNICDETRFFICSEKKLLGKNLKTWIESDLIEVKARKLFESTKNRLVKGETVFIEGSLCNDDSYKCNGKDRPVNIVFAESIKFIN